MKKIVAGMLTVFSIFLIGCKVKDLSNTTRVNTDGSIIITSEVSYAGIPNIEEKEVLRILFGLSNDIEIKKSFSGSYTEEQVIFKYDNYKDLLADEELKKMYDYTIELKKGIFKDTYNISSKFNKKFLANKEIDEKFGERIATVPIRNTIIAEGKIIESNSTNEIVSSKENESIEKGTEYVTWIINSNNIEKGMVMKATIEVNSYLWVGILIGIIILLVIILVIVRKDSDSESEIPLESK